MEYKGLWGNNYDSGREDYESSLLEMKRKAKEFGSYLVGRLIGAGVDMEYIEKQDCFSMEEWSSTFGDILEDGYKWKGLTPRDKCEIELLIYEGMRDKLFQVKIERGCVSDSWPRKMKKYCVEFNYNCCSHYTVDAISEEDAIEKASELDLKLIRKDRVRWYDNMDIEFGETQVREED